MITEIKKYSAYEPKQLISELTGLSTDAKPIDKVNGSIFVEIDTGKQFIFDEENTNWCERG